MSDLYVGQSTAGIPSGAKGFFLFKDADMGEGEFNHIDFWTEYGTASGSGNYSNWGSDVKVYFIRVN